MSDEEKKPQQVEPPKSLAVNSADRTREMRERQWVCQGIIKKYDENKTWDAIQAKDVPSELLKFVEDRIRRGWKTDRIREAMGIRRATDPAWRKIMAAFRQGIRIDQTALLQHKAAEYERVSKKLYDQIMDAFENGTEVMTPTGQIVRLEGANRELAAVIDTFNKLTQGFVKVGKDLGAYIDGPSESKGGQGGVHIHVHSKIQLPSQAEIDARRKAQIAQPDVIVDSVRVEDGKPKT